MRKMRFSRGLTISELMIVVVIIAFLALLAFWAVRTQVYKGFDARRKADIHRIKVAVEEYEKDHDCYPTPDLVVCTPQDTGLRPYLDKIPCDPRTKASYYYDHENSSCPKWYRLYATFENLKDLDFMGPLGPGNAFNYYSGSPNAPYPSGAASDFYGCRSGVCVPILWNPSRPGAECDPNFGSSSCYGKCTDPNTGAPINECTQI